MRAFYDRRRGRRVSVRTRRPIRSNGTGGDVVERRPAIREIPSREVAVDTPFSFFHLSDGLPPDRRLLRDFDARRLSCPTVDWSFVEKNDNRIVERRRSGLLRFFRRATLLRNTRRKRTVCSSTRTTYPRHDF